MKYITYIVFTIIFGALLFQVYNFNDERRELAKERAIIIDEVDLVFGENSDIKNRIEYFSDPRNLEKELRARFNYRFPYEKLIIVVPALD